MSITVNNQMRVRCTWNSTPQGSSQEEVVLNQGDEVTIDPEAPEEAHGRVYITKAGKHCWLYDNEVNP